MAPSWRFMSVRKDHSFIGVFDVAAKTLRYLDPSVDRDLMLRFGRPIVTRSLSCALPADTGHEPFGARRAGPPWSIRDGRCGDRYRAAKFGKRMRGRAASSMLWRRSSNCFWTAENRLVFPWEGDGWPHLYSVPPSGGAATLMTPGDFEVENATLYARPPGNDLQFQSG